MIGLSPLITTTTLTAFHLPRGALIQLLPLPYLHPQVQRHPRVDSEVILSGPFFRLPLTFLTFVPSCKSGNENIIGKAGGSMLGIAYIYHVWWEASRSRQAKCVILALMCVVAAMAERIYDCCVKTAVCSPVYGKTQSVSEECRVPLWDESSVFPREKPSSELLCFCAPSLFSPLTLVISSKEEEAHERRKLGEKDLFLWIMH